ncbi:hypothetical protein ACHQM5_020318 [Ranunculus cassubicifolius]
MFCRGGLGTVRTKTQDVTKRTQDGRGIWMILNARPPMFMTRNVLHLISPRRKLRGAKYSWYLSTAIFSFFVKIYQLSSKGLPWNPSIAVN